MYHNPLSRDVAIEQDREKCGAARVHPLKLAEIGGVSKLGGGGGGGKNA